MRKKSHISLAWYLMNSEGMEALQAHKGSFYIGSILPDCMPSFLVRRHTFEEAFDVLEKELRKLVSHFDPKKGINCYFCRHLGVITHYISDFFTFPHNDNFPGNLKDHCVYEEGLKHGLRAYIREPKAIRQCGEMCLKSSEDILTYVHEMHDAYKKSLSGVERDCRYITVLCHNVVDAILCMIEQMSGIQISIAM